MALQGTSRTCGAQWLPCTSRWRRCDPRCAICAWRDHAQNTRPVLLKTLSDARHHALCSPWQIHALELETGAATQQSQQLPRRRANMLATVEMLRAVEGVAQAQAALHSLLGPHCGVAVDYAGTIDVLEVLQGVLDNEDILSLDCLR